MAPYCGTNFSSVPGTPTKNLTGGIIETLLSKHQYFTFGLGTPVGTVEDMCTHTWGCAYVGQRSASRVVFEVPSCFEPGSLSRSSLSTLDWLVGKLQGSTCFWDHWDFKPCSAVSMWVLGMELGSPIFMANSSLLGDRRIQDFLWGPDVWRRNIVPCLRWGM